MEVKLTKDADTLICVLYKEYSQRRKDSISKPDAKLFGSSQKIKDTLMQRWSFDDVAETCRELSRAGLLNCKYADDEAYFIQLSDDAIIYMENRFKNGLKDVVDYIEKVIGLINPF